MGIIASNLNRLSTIKKLVCRQTLGFNKPRFGHNSEVSRIYAVKPGISLAQRGLNQQQADLGGRNMFFLNMNMWIETAIRKFIHVSQCQAAETLI